MNSRRKFIIGGAAAIAGSALLLDKLLISQESPALPKKYFAACHSDFISEVLKPEVFEKKFTPRVPSTLNLLEIETKKNITKIEIPIFPHSVTQSFAKPHIVAGIERWNTRAVLVDIKDQKILAILNAPDEHYFYGHSAFTPDGSKLCISGVLNETKAGFVFVFDTKSGNLINQISTNYASPHDVLFLQDNILCVANSGYGNHVDRKSSLSFIDINLAKVIDQKENPAIWVTHLCQISKEDLVISSGLNGNTYPTLSSYSISKKQFDHIGTGAEGTLASIAGEALSLASNSSSTVFSTVSESKYLLEWNLKNSTLDIHSVNNQYYNLAAVDDNYLLSGVKFSGDLYQLQKSNSKIVETFITEKFANSSHARCLI